MSSKAAALSRRSQAKAVQRREQRDPSQIPPPPDPLPVEPVKVLTIVPDDGTQQTMPPAEDSLAVTEAVEVLEDQSGAEPEENMPTPAYLDNQTTSAPDNIPEHCRALAVKNSPRGRSDYRNRVSITVNDDIYRRLLHLDHLLAKEGSRSAISRNLLLTAAIDLISGNPEEWAARGEAMEPGENHLQGRVDDEHRTALNIMRHSEGRKCTITAMLSAAITDILTN